MAVVWERHLTLGRRQQSHVFVKSTDGGPDRSACGVVTRTEGWGPDKTARRCMTCRRKVDPDNAPKAPSWRMPSWRMPK